MRFAFPLQSTRRHRGVALVIVLAFVVLLTGLILAFFSRAISERQISNSSAGQVKVDLFALGAADTIIGDLKQEIAAGSKIVSLAPAGKVYAPKPPTATTPPAFATVTPAIVLGLKQDGTPVVNNGGLNNLVKRSARNQPFFAADPNAAANANYNTQDYPPAVRAAPVRSGPNGPDDTINDYTSANGRYISAERWNGPLLLAKKSLTSETVTPASDFVSPDWVLVTREGKNPSAWNNNLVTHRDAPTSVVGRYAYNVYDEGGLLDANVAGYPSTSTPAQSASKSALAYADLGQVLDPNGEDPQGTAKLVDALVSWRNYASTKAPDVFPVPNFNATSAENYYRFVLGNARGFLTVGGTALYNQQSDRLFASRQELMKLLLQGIGTGGATRIKLQNALQYLGTFSRGLEQPSFIKPQSVDASDALGYDSSAPKLLAPTNGGNNAGPGGTNPALDAAINPSFLAVRVATAKPGGRFGGGDLVAGEPLVRKRFPLSRLAWLTYLGPSAARTIPTADPGANSPDRDLWQLVNSYGISRDHLKLGTAENIRYCFGLDWDGKRWLYDVHNRGGSSGPICKLNYAADPKDVLRDGREPDFFELLKATVNVGSLAKTATTPTPSTLPGGSSGSYQIQYNQDSSVDAASRPNSSVWLTIT